uniref:AAA+ ATPase domain-containing protein n=1 Tax=Oryza glumipatula TaxID=40148 RepID=A0A0E0ADT5_9ORYZ
MGAPLKLTWASLGSLFATAVLVRTAVRDFLPPEAHGLLRALLSRAAAALAPPCDAIIVHETDANGVPNELYEAAQLYLGARCLATAPAMHLHKTHGAAAAVASLPDSHATLDAFRGVRVLWTSQLDGTASSSFGGSSSSSRGFVHHPFPIGGRQRCLRLEFRRRDRDVVRDAYIPFVLEEAAALRAKMRERKLYTNNSGFYGGGGGGMDDHQMLWKAHKFSHPSTFDSLAIDPALRDDIRADLLRFVRSREHYARAGRAWKRGYLLHGPPGTGKTSLVAAIANLLEFDIYDLELTTVTSNYDLRRLLASTRPKSVIVVEDVDCSLGLFDRTRSPAPPSSQDDDADADEQRNRAMLQHALTLLPPAVEAAMQRETISLSGVLNFVDGLWSSCVGERLVVFTTNHMDRLDPALLRPGRMDRKVELGYCKAPALRVLAKNYLGDDDADDHDEIMGEAGRLLEEVQVTPADVTEVFMGCDGDDGAHDALQKLVDELNARKEKMNGPK